MTIRFKSVTLLVILGAVILTGAKKLPSYIKCTDSRDCPAKQCCRLGGNRYSFPTCDNMTVEGEYCRGDSGGPYNTTVQYPNGIEVELTNIYFILCDCEDGLVCNSDARICTKEN